MGRATYILQSRRALTCNWDTMYRSGWFGGGGTHIFGRTGMCRSNVSLFCKKSLNMGPVFYQKILKHGSTFLTEPKFLGFRHPKIAKFLKNEPSFQEKSLKWVPFSAKITLKRWVGVLRLEQHTSVQLKSEYPPGVDFGLLPPSRMYNQWIQEFQGGWGGKNFSRKVVVPECPHTVRHPVSAKSKGDCMSGAPH